MIFAFGDAFASGRSSSVRAEGDESIVSKRPLACATRPARATLDGRSVARRGSGSEIGARLWIRI
jgi:hypothetical protein